MTPRTRAALALGAVFLLGAATGSAATRFATARAMHKLHDAPPGEARQHVLLAALDRRLSLTPEQHARVEAILTSHRGELTAVARKLEPDLAPVIAQIQSEIRATLTPEQQGKFDEMAARYNERRRRSLGE
jgi:Spy/CpxP family protein refolding chaperone